MKIKILGLTSYLESQVAMQSFVGKSTPETEDEIWFVEHPAVYTQGTACDLGTFIASNIPVVKSDRGGQITFHGPGQLVMYVLLNVKRNGLGVKGLVEALEQTMINVLSNYQIHAERLAGAPGVYVNGEKIGALGLRVRRGFSYHGLSLNVDMDLSPFQNIDPCGYKDMPVTQIKDQLSIDGQTGSNQKVTIEQVQQSLLDSFLALLPVSVEEPESFIN